MRIVSLVPSWTETLIEAGADVVGRTRFCIHPAEKVKNITAVGGTKSVDLALLKSLSPDLVVMDREENTLGMFEQIDGVATVFVSHVENVSQMPFELSSLASVIGSVSSASQNSFEACGVTERLKVFADRYRKVLGQKCQFVLAKEIGQDPFAYCIWKDPWMAIGRDTFIASMLEQMGLYLANLYPQLTGKYPKFDLEGLPPKTHVLLSTEPFPFDRHIDDIRRSHPLLKFEIIDGESFSWFGLRALQFLEASIN